ncbi:hypothetical protein V8C86DRAFT_3033588, partial [Haematococcus lacustris]
MHSAGVAWAFPWCSCVDYSPSSSPYSLSLTLLNNGIEKIEIASQLACLRNVRVLIDGLPSPASGVALPANFRTVANIKVKFSSLVRSSGTTITIIGSGACSSWPALFGGQPQGSFIYSVFNWGTGVRCCPIGAPPPSPPPSPAPPPPSPSPFPPASGASGSCSNPQIIDVGTGSSVFVPSVSTCGTGNSWSCRKSNDYTYQLSAASVDRLITITTCVNNVGAWDTYLFAFPTQGSSCPTCPAGAVEDDDGGPCGRPRSQLTITALAGQAYTVVVESWNDSQLGDIPVGRPVAVASQGAAPTAGPLATDPGHSTSAFPSVALVTSTSPAPSTLAAADKPQAQASHPTHPFHTPAAARPTPPARSRGGCSQRSPVLTGRVLAGFGGSAAALRPSTTSASGLLPAALLPGPGPWGQQAGGVEGHSWLPAEASQQPWAPDPLAVQYRAQAQAQLQALIQEFDKEQVPGVRGRVSSWLKAGLAGRLDCAPPAVQPALRTILQGLGSQMGPLAPPASAKLTRSPAAASPAAHQAGSDQDMADQQRGGLRPASAPDSDQVMVDQVSTDPLPTVTMVEPERQPGSPDHWAGHPRSTLADMAPRLSQAPLLPQQHPPSAPHPPRPDPAPLPELALTPAQPAAAAPCPEGMLSRVHQLLHSAAGQQQLVEHLHRLHARQQQAQWRAQLPSPAASPFPLPGLGRSPSRSPSMRLHASPGTLARLGYRELLQGNEAAAAALHHHTSQLHATRQLHQQLLDSPPPPLPSLSQLSLRQPHCAAPRCCPCTASSSRLCCLIGHQCTAPQTLLQPLGKEPYGLAPLQQGQQQAGGQVECKLVQQEGQRGLLKRAGVDGRSGESRPQRGRQGALQRRHHAASLTRHDSWANLRDPPPISAIAKLLPSAPVVMDGGIDEVFAGGLDLMEGLAEADAPYVQVSEVSTPHSGSRACHRSSPSCRASHRRSMPDSDMFSNNPAFTAFESVENNDTRLPKRQLRRPAPLSSHAAAATRLLSHSSATFDEQRDAFGATAKGGDVRTRMEAQIALRVTAPWSPELPGPVALPVASRGWVGAAAADRVSGSHAMSRAEPASAHITAPTHHASMSAWVACGSMQPCDWQWHSRAPVAPSVSSVGRELGPSLLPHVTPITPGGIPLCDVTPREGQQLPGSPAGSPLLPQLQAAALRLCGLSPDISDRCCSDTDDQQLDGGRGRGDEALRAGLQASSPQHALCGLSTHEALQAGLLNAAGAQPRTRPAGPWHSCSPAQPAPQGMLRAGSGHKPGSLQHTLCGLSTHPPLATCIEGLGGGSAVADPAGGRSSGAGPRQGWVQGSSNLGGPSGAPGGSQGGVAAACQASATQHEAVGSGAAWDCGRAAAASGASPDSGGVCFYPASGASPGSAGVCEGQVLLTALLATGRPAAAAEEVTAVLRRWLAWGQRHEAQQQASQGPWVPPGSLTQQAGGGLRGAMSARLYGVAAAAAAAAAAAGHTAGGEEAGGKLQVQQVLAGLQRSAGTWVLPLQGCAQGVSGEEGEGGSSRPDEGPEAAAQGAGPQQRSARGGLMAAGCTEGTLWLPGLQWAARECSPSWGRGGAVGSTGVWGTAEGG